MGSKTTTTTSASSLAQDAPALPILGAICSMNQLTTLLQLPAGSIPGLIHRLGLVPPAPGLIDTVCDQNDEIVY